MVYSWGVLHHTGALWTALQNVAPLVENQGQLFIAIYNDQGRISNIWLRVKKIYNILPSALRGIILYPTFLRLWGPTIIRDMFSGHPLKSWRDYINRNSRGMNAWYDVVDWVGGLPFEVAKPEDIIHFYQKDNFQLKKLKTCGGGLGCNEYVFRRSCV